MRPARVPAPHSPRRQCEAILAWFLSSIGRKRLPHHGVYLTDSWVRLACLSWALTGARPVVLRAVHLAMSLATRARRSPMAAESWVVGATSAASNWRIKVVIEPAALLKVCGPASIT